MTTPAPPVTASAPSTEHGVGRGVLTAPAAWYSRPEADGYTRLTVTDDGEVYGHVAPWGASHRGTGVSSDIVRGDDFSAFHTGRVRTAEGTDLDVGALTIGGGHAPLDAPARAAAEHYDDVATAWAHVRATNGAHGIWVSGSVAPGVNDLTLHKARAFPPSGDWRWLDGGYRMVACCQVVVPGFPVHELRAQVASMTAEHLPLVASAAQWESVTAAGDLAPMGGPPFRVKVYTEGTVSRDGRSIDPGATYWSAGPWPLWNALRDTHGGEEAEGTVVVGRIDTLERVGDDIVATGAFDTSEHAVEAARLVEQGLRTTVSADLGAMEGTYLGGEMPAMIEAADGDTVAIPDEPFDSAEPWLTVQKAELVGVTMVGVPAFADATIALTGPAAVTDAPETVAAALRSGSFRATGRVLLAAAAAPVVPVEDRLAALEERVTALETEEATEETEPGEPVAASLNAARSRLRRQQAVARLR